MKKLSGILLIFFLTGCSAGTIILAQTPTVTTIPPTVTPLPTATPDVTSMLAFEPIFAPTALYENVNVESKCVAVSQDVQNTNVGNGVAILESTTDVPLGLYFLNMETGILTNLNGQAGRLLLGESVSPDRTLLSVLSLEPGSKKILIMLADGKVKKELPSKKEWAGGWAWQDNQHLMINLAEPHLIESDLVPHDKLTLGKMLSLNPFTGEERILVIDFPNMFFNGAAALSWESPWGQNFVVYNPSLTRAVYLAEERNNYLLWDAQKKKTLIRWFSIDINHPPRWSPDGSKFLMEVADPSNNPGDYPNGLYLVSDNGNVSLPVLLTYAETHISVTDYFWSPSGRYVALQALGNKNSDGYYKYRLLVLDVQTRKIMDYCVESYEPILTWSPDETQILLNDKYSQDHQRVILVDLAKGTAFPIAEDMVATGWMKSP